MKRRHAWFNVETVLSFVIKSIPKIFTSPVQIIAVLSPQAWASIVMDGVKTYVVFAGFFVQLLYGK